MLSFVPFFAISIVRFFIFVGRAWAAAKGELATSRLASTADGKFG